ncbi:DNA/RNA helicase domain-containing protein [Curtobacterium pusillum]|uniref:DNA/RNA helicase domain-containing protein n=1 Tax=Curtobacterium pusillum TaxID=69373 RepID=UPI00380799C7
MTSFDIAQLPFNERHLRLWREEDPRFLNWPVVYILDDGKRVYVGETLNTASRMRQHLDSAERRSLKAVRLVLDSTFNKSVCLDLESQLIGLFAGDDKYTVLNSNKGVVNADYYDRARYRATFEEIFEALREQELFTRSIAEIENSELFKLSPFKALNRDQAVVTEDILEGLFDDLSTGSDSTIVVQGDPGTGKTIVAVYLIKLLRDIANGVGVDETDGDAMFSDYFTAENRARLADFRVGLVIPQQALRSSLKRVFSKTPGLEKTMVLTPFEVGKSAEKWDLLVVDESHRLNQRANQASGPLNKSFGEINKQLFGADADHYTQLDWIRNRSRHQIFLLDSEQSVRPADLPERLQKDLVNEVRQQHRYYRLLTQMRVQGGADYVSYVRAIMRGDSPKPRLFGDYDFRMFDDLGEMHDAIRALDDEVGLSRLVAGYAWEWKSKRDRSAIDIEIDGRELQWNQTQTDWITSPGAVDQVGSIHTVQGYDLNYVGVIIGPDLRLDPVSQEIVFDRSNYFDKKGMENNPRLGISYTEADIQKLAANIYAVLLTRGVKGCYVYVSDFALRQYLNLYFSV